MSNNTKPLSKIQNIDELKDELAKFLKKVKKDNQKENTKGRRELPSETYWYNVGQIDLANSILAQIAKL